MCQQHFPFEQLPAEIRSMVYKCLAIQESKGCEKSISTSFHTPRIELRNVHLPCLTAVSKSMRHESLQDTFSSRRFSIPIASPWLDCERFAYLAYMAKTKMDIGIMQDLILARHEAADPTDPIFLTGRVELLLEKYAKEAIFEDVQFCSYLNIQHGNSVSLRSWQIVTLTLVWQHRRLDVETSGENEVERARELVAMGPAVDLAKGATLRDGFKGFTVVDLRRIAAAMVQGTFAAHKCF